jgi:Stress responsive A/B Barrel Domain
MTAMLHFVGYTQPDGADVAQVQRVRDGFAALSAAIDGAELLAVGPNISPSDFAKSWDYAAIVAFRDVDVRAAYIAHPLHDQLGRETRDGFYDRCIVLDVPRFLPNPPGEPS